MLKAIRSANETLRFNLTNSLNKRKSSERQFHRPEYFRNFVAVNRDAPNVLNISRGEQDLF